MRRELRETPKPARGRSGVEITRLERERLGQPICLRVHRRSAAHPSDYTVGDIARGTGLSKSAVSLILTGRRTGQLQTLERLAVYLGVTLDVLNAYLITQRPPHRR